MTEGNTRKPRNDFERDIANDLDVAAMACGLNATPDQILFMVESVIDSVKAHGVELVRGFQVSAGGAAVTVQPEEGGKL